jgi:hypothetical protein
VYPAGVQRSAETDNGEPDFGETEQWVGCRRRCMDFRSRPEPVVTLAMRFVRVLALPSGVR